MKKFWMLLLVVLAGCVGMSKVGPGAHVVRETLVVSLDKAWNKLDSPGLGKQEIWTTEGLALDTLRFFVDIREGEPLIERRNVKDKQIAVFRGTMQPNDIVELFDSSVTADGSLFKLVRLSAADFAGERGFRFEFTLLRKGDEVELRGIAYGGIRQGALNLVVFTAPKVHFYSRIVPRVEDVVKSASYLGRGKPAALATDKLAQGGVANP